MNKKLIVLLVVSSVISASSFGHLSARGKTDYIITNASFDSLFVARQENKWGFITRQGEVAIPFLYEGIKVDAARRFKVVRVSNKEGLIDATGTYVLQPIYDKLEYVVQDSVYRVDVNKKTGLILPNGNWLVQPEFDELFYYWIDGKTVYRKGKRYGIVSCTGKMSPQNYRSSERAISVLHSSRSSCCNDRTKTGNRGQTKFGYKDRNGKLVISMQYKMAEKFSEGLASVSIDGIHWHYIDTSGNTILPGPYRNASSFVDGLAFVNGDSVINRRGELIFVSEFVIIGYEPLHKLFRIEAPVTEMGGGTGLMDTTGRIIVDPTYFDRFVLPVEGMIRAGKEIPNDTMITSHHDYKWTYIDMHGRQINANYYSDLHDFSEGLAAVKVDSKWGFIDTTGKVVIPFEYDDACNFDRGLACVTRDGKMTYIDRTGKTVWKEK